MLMENFVTVLREITEDDTVNSSMNESTGKVLWIVD